MLPTIKANSRCVFLDFSQNIELFEFGSNYVEKTDVEVWLNNELLIELDDEYEWVNNTTIKVLIPREDNSVVEMVRITSPSSPVTPTELIYMIEEKRDELVFNNDRGPQFDALIADHALLTNELATDNPVAPFIFPVIQMLPDGGLAPYPDGLNPGGFHEAALRFQHYIPASVKPQSMTAGGWFSLVLAKPDDEALMSKKTCYGFRFLFKGYQNGTEEHEFEHGAINPVAETGAGATRGNAQAIIAEARHEPAQATRIIGTGISELIFTAQGTEGGRGEAGNHIHIEILAAAASGNVIVTADEPAVGETTITIIPKTNEDTADEIAVQVAESEEASFYVAVTSGGPGQVAPAPLEPLLLGMDTDGKLVGAQIVLTPRGKDPGPGYAHANGGIVLSDGSFESFGYTANTNGFHTGFAAIIAKGKADPGEAHTEGWYNAFVAHYKTRSRLLWMPLHCAIEAPGFEITDGPNPRSHDSMRMGLGTDEPEGTLHIKTAPTASVPDYVETPEIILDNAIPLSEFNANVGRIVMRAPGATEAQSMVLLAGVLTSPLASDDDAKLSLSVAEGGTLTARWNLAGGIWAEGVTGDNKGPGSINVSTVHVEDVPALRKLTGGGLALNFGAPQARTISGDAITFAGSSMLITAEGGAADDLTTINGGTTGDVLIIRKPSDGHTVTVKHSASIKCGANRALGNNASLLLTCISSGVWSAEG